MKTFPILLTLLLSIVFITLGKGQSADAKLISITPTPQEVTPKSGNFKITSQTKIILGEGALGEDTFAAEQINAQLKEFKQAGLKIVKEASVKKLMSNYIFIGSPASRSAKQWLTSKKVSLDPHMKDEGYILSADKNGVVIIAESPRGRFYGVMSLCQMMERAQKNISVPHVLIRDWPLQAVRGITDDLSRGQVSTMENFKKIIRFLARYKLNVYSPYIEDIFVFKNYPAIGKGRGELTAAEMKALDAYAKQYYVELIPIFETLGHWENILLMPEYVKYAEFSGAHTVNVSDEAVYTMLDEMIGELADAFSSPYFNMAADESWDVGLGVNKGRVAASDLATVHAEHYKRVFEIIKKHGKKPMMYGDIILDRPAILEKIPKDVVIVDWHYSVADFYPSTVTFKSAGFPYIVSPAVWNFTGPFPSHVNTLNNIQNFNRDGYLNGSLGLLTSSWNDYGGEALRELNYYGYAWTAECAWQPLKANLADFNKQFFADFFGNKQAGQTAQTVYAILSDPLNELNWHELWRHPMLPPRQSLLHYLLRAPSMLAMMPLVQQLLGELKSSATRNQNHIQYLEFVSHLNQWFAKKMLVGEKVRKLTNNIPPSANPEGMPLAQDSIRMAVLNETKDIVPELTKLKQEFKSLWLTTNRPANLQWLMMRYDRQAAYWQEKIAEVSQGELWKDPIIESAYIYHPNVRAGNKENPGVQVPRAYFRKTFSVNQMPSSAKLQLLGDTHAKVWVNGAEVGEVYARNSLSLIVEHSRMKMWDVASLLKQGDNVIAVEAANYSERGSAGVNIYMELQSGVAIEKVLSDSTWKVSDIPAEGWKSVQFNDASYQQAMPRSYPAPVIRPNFESGRLSWIEH